MIHGTTVKLISRVQTGTDPFNAPVYTETEIEVENVLVGQPMQNEIVDAQSLESKRAAYSLGIPKGDTHVWKDQIVEIFGRRFKVFGDVTEGIEANVPGPWHHIWQVEHYE